MFLQKKLSTSIRTILMLSTTVAYHSSLAADNSIEEIQVIGITPGSATTQDIDKVPFAVQSATYNDIDQAQSLDLSDFLNSKLSSVNINSAQNNPLQADVQFRGFTASPLLGLSQGLAVYQNGVRINEPLGDAVNWDLVPESTIYSIDLISGANPVFGLNTLGGALAVTLKDGFNFSNTQVEAYTGAWGRNVITLESGNNFVLNNDSEWAYYVNFNNFDEEGWRDLSESKAQNFYGALSWRNSDISTLNLSYQKGDSDLTGNGALPIGLTSSERDAVFTAPDITENDMQMLNLEASHFISDGIQLSGNIFWRENTTDSFNGDGSEFELCEYSGGAQSLFEEAEDTEEDLEDLLNIELDDICDGADPSITDFNSLENFIENQALLASLDPEDFELEDIIDDLSGTGRLSDEAINNISQRQQETRGLNGQITFTDDFFQADNQLILGYAYFKGETNFTSVLELSELDPITRNTAGLGTGTFFDEAETDINTQIQTYSLFFTDTFQLSQQLALTLSGRYNNIEIKLRDRSGERPELNGDHSFSRFNPAIGITFDANENTNLYASYSESSRVPTPIELACNEGVFEVAQQFAIAAGEDPDDIEFECRLPNAFLADPPLDEVITKSIEFGMRGELAFIDNTQYQFGFFRSQNQNDILFQSTGRSTGLFDNVDRTQRQGFESQLAGGNDSFKWYGAYSYIQATFQDNFMILSPNHPNANTDGELLVQKGDSLPGLPEHIFKFGGDLYINNQLSVGAELIYNSEQFIRGDEVNDLDPVDGYTLVNLRASYQLNDHFSVFSRVTNAFDAEFENFGLLGESPEEILPNLTDNRPFFLGVGAPRGMWIGFKYTL